MPHLHRVRELGANALVECSPAYLGRDPILLKRLSEASRLHLVTNTGYYGAADDKSLPPHAFTETADQLAARWTRECQEGIEDTGVRPGFIKIDVDPGRLSDVDGKLVKAAARTHLATGLAIAAHATDRASAMEELSILREEGVDGSAFIWVHGHAESDTDFHIRAAGQKAWVEFDSVHLDTIHSHEKLVAAMRKHGRLGRVLISHNAGWYSVGRPHGGDFRSYDNLFTQFLPALKKAGLRESEIRQLTVDNSREAFAIRVLRTC